MNNCPTITVEINMHYDAWNWWDCVNNRRSYGIDWVKRCPKELVPMIMGKTQKEARLALCPFLEQKYKQINIENTRTTFQAGFDEKRHAIFEAMEKLTGKPIFQDNIICYLTTFQSYPYDTKIGALYLNATGKFDNQVEIFLHELLHLQAHYYWEKNSEKL